LDTVVSYACRKIELSGKAILVDGIKMAKRLGTYIVDNSVAVKAATPATAIVVLASL
jgi:hypothetical protein